MDHPDRTRFQNAKAFFDQEHGRLKNRGHAVPEFRGIDLKVKAQSVFRPIPYQRNIQTGSFRIWTELSGSTGIGVWPWSRLENSKGSLLAEAYPSWMARNLFGLKSRSPQEFLRWMKTNGTVRVSFKKEVGQKLLDSTEATDSAILAMGSMILYEQSPEAFKSTPRKRREGWILGVTEAS
jgi:hypothetical protein